MHPRTRTLPALLAATLLLAGCGGGGGTSPVPPAPGGGASAGGSTSASISISPSYLGFTTPTSAPQQFTVSSSGGAVAAPAMDATSCAGVASVSGGSATLPATYTVTPNAASAGGGCTLVFVSGTNTATLPIGVSPPPNGAGYTGPTSVSASPGGLSFAGPGAPAQNVGVTAAGGGPGTVLLNTQSCAGIAAVTWSSGPAPQTFAVSPLALGTCSVVVVDGIASTTVPVSIGATTAAAVTVNPATLTFASRNAAPQNVTVGVQGNVGQVTVDQHTCQGIAVFTIPNGSLPQTGTVTPVATGSCTVTFTPSSGQAATLGITVQ